MHKKLISVLIGLILIFGGGTVRAGEKHTDCYRLISGKEDLMCRLFLQNLNSFCNEPGMVCERKIHPDFAKYFTLPNWEEVDLTENLEIIADYVKAQVPRNAKCADEKCQKGWQEKKWQEYKTGLLERLKTGKVKFHRAICKLTRYSNKESVVYRLVDFPCSPTDANDWDNPQVPKLIVTDEETGKLDSQYTAIFQFGGPYDVLIYEKLTYFTVWRSDFPSGGNMTIEAIPYTPCMFKYTGNKGDKK